MVIEPAIISWNTVTYIKRLFYLVCSVLQAFKCNPTTQTQNEVLGTIKNEEFCFLLCDFKKYILKSSEIERKGFLF